MFRDGLIYQGHRLVVAIHPRNGTALNLWEAEPELAGDRFAVYAPGLHHVCWNVAAASRVDAVAALVGDLGYEVLDGPGEFPFAEGGYYAVYFRGPDGLKLEVVFMPELAGSLSGR